MPNERISDLFDDILCNAGAGIEERIRSLRPADRRVLFEALRHVLMEADALAGLGPRIRALLRREPTYTYRCGVVRYRFELA